MPQLAIVRGREVVGLHVGVKRPPEMVRVGFCACDRIQSVLVVEGVLPELALEEWFASGIVPDGEIASAIHCS